VHFKLPRSSLAVDFAHCSLHALGQVPRQKAWPNEDDQSQYEETDNDGDPPSTLRAISHPGSCTHRQKKRGAIKCCAPPRRHIKMGRQHLRDGLLHVRQSKTGKVLAIPLHPNLRAVLDATPAEHLTFLTTRGGKPFNADAFGHWFKHECREAGLPANASVHGLRKAACRRLAEGCSASVIASISGHASLREVQRYVESAEQTLLARLGIEAVSRTETVKPSAKV
jgi:hypothetical protein